MNKALRILLALTGLGLFYLIFYSMELMFRWDIPSWIGFPTTFIVIVILLGLMGGCFVLAVEGGEKDET